MALNGMTMKSCVFGVYTDAPAAREITKSLRDALSKTNDRALFETLADTHEVPIKKERMIPPLPGQSYRFSMRLQDSQPWRS